MRVLILSLAILSLSVARADEASRFIRLTWDPSVFALGEEALGGLFASPPILLGEGRGVAGIAFAPIARSDPGPGLPSSILFALRIETSSGSAAALIEEVAGRLEALLAAEHTAFVERLESALREASEERERTRRELEGIRAAIAERRGALRAEAVARELDAARARLAELERELHASELGAAAKEARAEALAKRIAEHGSEKRPASAEADAVVRELRRIVEVRTEQLARLRALREQGRASPADIDEAQAKLAEAKVELARREDELGRPRQASEALTTLRAEHRAILATLEDERARRASLQERLARCRAEVEALEKRHADVARAALSAEEMELDLALARRRYEETAGDLDALRRRAARLAPPRVAILERPEPERGGGEK